MDQESRYHHNLEIWSHHHPKEAIWLQYLEPSRLQACRLEDGQWTLKNAEGLEYYSAFGPLEEAAAWKRELDLSDAEVLYVYGTGLGYYLDPLKPWLGESMDHQLVFLEDDLEVLAKLFESEKGTELLNHPQVHIFFFREIGDADRIFNLLFWNFPKAKIKISALKYYQQARSERFEELSRQLLYDSSVKNALLDEYLQFGLPFYRNFYPNLRQINSSYLGNALFGQFEGVPAIICGAGPSLEKNASLLKQLSSRAILFAGSSALNALDAKGIHPHLGAGIDPNPMQEQRLKNVKNLDFPFLYRSRMFSGALQLVKGPKLYVKGAGGYAVADWFEDQLGITGESIEEGRNVINFCLELAHRMGCNPIIFVGVDLAFTGRQRYVDGVLDPSRARVEEGCDPENPEEALVLRTDIDGNPVHTLWKWIAEAQWIGDFAQRHPEKILINATEGGLGFPEVVNESLKNAAEEYLQKEYDIPEMLEAAYRPHALSGISTERIDAAVEVLRTSLYNCQGYLDSLIEKNQHIQQAIREGKETEEGLASGQTAMEEIALMEEEAFQPVIQIFNEVAARLMQRNLAELHHPANPLSPSEKELKKLELLAQKYRFLSHAVSVNLLLIDLKK